MSTRSKAHKIPPFRYSPLFWSISSAMLLLNGMEAACAQEYFNPAFLEYGNPDQAGVDLSVFEDGQAQAPGQYYVDVYLNREHVEASNIDFALEEVDGVKKLTPCLSKGFLEALGVRVDAFPDLDAADAGGCANLAAIPDATTNFSFSQQRLDISIPQAAISNSARGYISPDKWDSGIPVAFMSYNFSGANTESRRSEVENSDTYYLNLRSGINVGPWRLRNYSVWNRDSRGDEKWENISTYVERDIKSVKGRLTMGESSSPSEIFDSVPFRGVQLRSDDDMLPNSLRGYAPVVRGIARTDAQISIRQNGYIIYQGYVPPGAFEIDDLYPTSGSGDLMVTVEESDGTEQHFIVPYASVPVLQREGRFKYSVTAGEYRPYRDGVDDNKFIQGTFMYGLPWRATIYGGVQTAGSKYQAVSLGWGQNMGNIGAISLDVTQAWSEPYITTSQKEKNEGQSWRLRYGKNFIESGTNFSLASYRYSTRGFYTMAETLDTYGDQSYYPDHKKSRAEITVSQRLWEGAGSLTLSAVKEQYWSDSRESENYSFGYNNFWRDISYGVYYSYAKNGMNSFGGRLDNTDHMLSLNISMPLGKVPGAYANYSMNTRRRGSTTHSVGVSGTALEDRNLNYNISQGYTNKGTGAHGSASVTYRGGQGTAGLGYAYNRDMQRVNYSIDGAVFLHENGITLSQPVNETMALVKAPGAKYVRIRNQTGVRTDGRGYAVVPFLSPYRKTEIALDPQSYADDLDLPSNVQTVIPTRGAVVRATFETKVGYRALVTLLRPNGQAVPFGAMVSIGEPADNGPNSYSVANSNIVGEGGQVYVSGLDEQGTLYVQWGSDASQQCQAYYNLGAAIDLGGIQMMKGECR